MKIPSWVQKHLKKKARVYIMPTRMGGYLNGLVFLMFLLSVGYSNNLLLIFTLFLFGLNLIWVIQTHYHLHPLKIENLSSIDGHAKDPSLIKVNWKNAPHGPYQWRLKLESENDSLEVSTLNDSETESNGQVIFPKRGVWKFQHLKVSTEMPFGLYKAWIYLPIEFSAFAWPAKLKDVPPVNTMNAEQEGELHGGLPGPHDVRDLGPYQGEEARKISWKHYAKSGELVVKEGEEFTNAKVHFKIPPNVPDKEFILSLMATQMVQCHRTDTTYDLVTPLKKTPPGSGEKHFQECMRELTKC